MPRATFTQARSATEKEAYSFLYKIVEGELSQKTIEEQLIEMANRGETIEEITGMARAMREHIIPIEIEGSLIDTCGTGGSGLTRINTSTLVALILAADGIRVAKHGNKAASGRCGSFDVLEKLGVNIELDAEAVAQCIQATHLGFIYAKRFHPVMKTIMPIRKNIGKRTIFNLLGPLLNPANADHHILGTTNIETAKKMIAVLKNLGLKRALVVTGEDGLDEITLTGFTTLFELKDGIIEQSTLDPTEIGIQTVSFEEIVGGDTEQNALTAKAILENRGSKAHTELVALNAGAGLYISGKTPSIKEGFIQALNIIHSGAALKKLEEYITVSQSFA